MIYVLGEFWWITDQVFDTRFPMHKMSLFLSPMSHLNFFAFISCIEAKQDYRHSNQMSIQFEIKTVLIFKFRGLKHLILGLTPNINIRNIFFIISVTLNCLK